MKKLAVIALCGLMAFPVGTTGFAAEEVTEETTEVREEITEEAADEAEDETTEEGILTEDVLTDAGLTMEDLQDAGLYYKTISENGEADEYEREYRFAKAAASLGSSEAMLWLGELYQGGKVEAASEVEDPVQTAIEWWTMAYENGQPRGYANIGLLYQHESIPGGGDDYGDIPLDYEKAFEYFLAATDAGDTKAPRYVGMCYRDGTGVEADLEKAVEYFKLASDLGDSTGKVYYADMLLAGEGTEQNVEEAMALYQDIVDTNGHDIALCAYKLGQIYDEGVYVEADAEKAAEYYQIAADNGSEDAQAALDAMN